MRLKSEYVLREMGQTRILVNEGEAVNMTRVLPVNESAAFLWKSLEGKDFTEDAVTALLLSEYDATPAQAADGAKAIIKAWKEKKLLEEG